MRKNDLVRLILATSIIFTSAGCSTFSKTLIASSATGAAIGAGGGMIFSPDVDSTSKNGFLFGVVGALIGAGLAYIFDPPKNNSHFRIVPQNQEGPPVASKEVPFFDFSPDMKTVRPELDFKPTKKYEVPLEKLPKELEGKVKKQYMIEYEADSKTLNLDNRTIEIGPFKAWEHVYE